MIHKHVSVLRARPPHTWVCGDASHLLHGVQQLGELVEALPVLAGVLLPLDDGFSQLLDVGHPDLVEDRLALQTVLGDCTHAQTSVRHRCDIGVNCECRLARNT